MDYYDELGVNKDASDKEIKLAYRRLAKKYHPDRNKSPHAEEKTKRINEAYNVLGDTNKKTEYDKSCSNIFGGFGKSNFNVNDIFGRSNFDFNKSHVKKTHKISKTFDSKLKNTIKITFTEAISGESKKILNSYKVECSDCNGYGGQLKLCGVCNGTGLINKNDGFISINTTCVECRGTGQKSIGVCPKCDSKGYIEKNEEIEINVPEGVEPRTTLFVKGKGNYINGTRGDLYISVVILPSDVYERKGNDILMTVYVDVFDVLVEKTINIVTFNGDINVELNNDIIENGIKIDGKGTKSIKGNTYGDLVVDFITKIPILTDSQKEDLKNIGWL